jgi:hypothetical protein
MSDRSMDNPEQPTEPAEPAPEPDPQEDAEAEEEVVSPPVTPLNLDQLIGDAEEVYAVISEKRGKEAADGTMVGFIVGLSQDSDAAMSAAIRSEAEKRAGEGPQSGPYARRRFAHRIAVAKQYDA